MLWVTRQYAYAVPPAIYQTEIGGQPSLWPPTVSSKSKRLNVLQAQTPCVPTLCQEYQLTIGLGGSGPTIVSVSLVWNHSIAPFSRMGSILIEIMHFNVLQNPCDLHNSKTINTTDVQSALYIIQLCFTQAKYNLWYILVHQPAFGLGLSAYRQSKQSKCNLQNPNTNETIQMQSTESFLAQLFCHKGGRVYR